MVTGRPRKFKDAKELLILGMKYIDKLTKEDKHLTYTGLCIALGTTKEVLKTYEDGKYDTEEQIFSCSVKELKLHCEQYAENRLFENNPTGAIFALKNYGWKDRQDIESINVNHNLNQDISSMTAEEIEKELKSLENEK